MSQSLAEAILRGLAGASEELGDEMQENQDFNLKRGDALQRYKEGEKWRREREARRQEESDRAYNFDVGQSKQHRLDRLDDRDYKYTLGQMDEEAERIRQRREDTESARRWNLGYDLDVSRENRLANQGGANIPGWLDDLREKSFWSNRKKVINPYSPNPGNPQYIEAPVTDETVDSVMSKRMGLPYPVHGPDINYQPGVPLSKQSGWDKLMGAVNTVRKPPAQFADSSMSAVAPLNQDPDTIGRQKYPDDWDTLPPEVKQALIEAGFPD